jgi:hypothetical protein
LSPFVFGDRRKLADLERPRSDAQKSAAELAQEQEERELAEVRERKARKVREVLSEERKG